MILLLLSFAVGAYIIIKKRRTSTSKPDYLPGDGLARRLKRWMGRTNSRGEYGTQLQPSESNPSLMRVSREGAGSRQRGRESSQDVRGEPHNEDPERQAPSGSTTTNGAGVGRNTSIRSIMTLPAYSETAGESEQILGVEGERAGMDVVLEFPEDQDEEETRRDEEMESLYQIRRARRQEQAEREERRRQRREARQRGDFAALVQLQEESRRRQDESLQSQTLIAEHQSANRERRVSSVQYADLGVARHDGSRIRANSTDSDKRPLLDSAASIAGSSQSIRPISTLSSHRRGRSASSVLSISSVGSDDLSSAPVAHRTVSADTDTDFEVVSLDRPRQHSSSGSRSPSLALVTTNQSTSQPEVDLADRPPQYDNLGWGEAPPYESPLATTRAPQLPTVAALTGGLPAIEISVASPISRAGSSFGGSRNASPSRR